MISTSSISSTASVNHNTENIISYGAGTCSSTNSRSSTNSSSSSSSRSSHDNKLQQTKMIATMSNQKTIITSDTNDTDNNDCNDNNNIEQQQQEQQQPQSPQNDNTTNNDDNNNNNSNNKTKKKREKPQWRDAVAGACAGAFSRTVMAPVERIKLLKQLQGSIAQKQHLTEASTSLTSSSTKATTVPKKRSISAWQLTKAVYTEQGILSFWRGNVPNVLRVSGNSAINFTCMDYYKRAVIAPWVEQNYFIIQKRYTTTTMISTTSTPPTEQQHQQQLTQLNTDRKRKLVTSFVSGGLAGATTTTLLYPIEFVRTRLAMDMGGTINKQREYTGMRNVVQSIYKTDGIVGLYQGYGIALAGGIFYRLIFFGGYDAFKNELIYHKTKKNHQEQHQQQQQKQQKQQPLLHDNITTTSTELSWMERIVSAQVISLTAGTLSYPFDSIRRRMMMQAGQPIRLYRHSIHCIYTVFQYEGIRGFYLGIGPNIVRSIGGALLLVGYDSVRGML